MASLTHSYTADESDDYHRIETTVFELAGEDKAGLLADITDLLCANDCNVRSAAVSTSPPQASSTLSSSRFMA